MAIYEDCGHCYPNGICDLINAYCENVDPGRACYEPLSDFMLNQTFGKSSKEKRPVENSDILKRLKNRYRTYQLTYAADTMDAKLIKDAIDELERLYTNKEQ